MGHRYYAAVRAAFHADLPRTVFDNHSELGLCIALLLDCSILPDASLSVSNPNNSLDWPASTPLWPRRDQWGVIRHIIGLHNPNLRRGHHDKYWCHEFVKTHLQVAFRATPLEGKLQMLTKYVPWWGHGRQGHKIDRTKTRQPKNFTRLNRMQAQLKRNHQLHFRCQWVCLEPAWVER